MQFFSKDVAQYLAASHNAWAKKQEGEYLYSVRGRKGEWFVWCDESDHAVEFDNKSVQAACLAAFNACANTKGGI